MEEIEFEEQEEYTEIHKKLKRRYRRRKNADNVNDGDKETTVNAKTNLNPYIIGAKPRKSSLPKDEKNLKRGNKLKCTKDIVKETLAELSNRQRRGSVFKPKGNRIFLGECDDDDESIFGKRSGLWKFKKTGKRGLDRFRRIVEFCTLARKIFQCDSSVKLSQEESILFFLNTQHGESQQGESSDSSKPLFDITPFKSLGQKSFVESVKKILEKPPEHRAENDINSILHQLQRFSRFSSYPQHIQRGLCKQGWYSRFERTKIIAREGKEAEFYYLILSGVAVSRSLRGESECEERRTVAEFLRQGDAIGEKEILTHKERATTIVCKEPVEVIGVDKETLLNIFKSSGGMESVDFLRSVPELEGFPLELLTSCHFSCSLHHYKRGSVIVKNSNESEWIYVIKSGSCQVFKGIKKRKDEHQTITNLKRELSEQFFPEITPRGSPNLRSSSVDDLVMKQKSKGKSRRPSIEKKVTLPQINAARNSLVFSGTESAMSSPRVKTPNKRAKKKPNYLESTTMRKESEDLGKMEYFLKLDIITERECFGLQSLIYKDTPSLSLVSNGADCILISKQFLMDNMDKELRKRLLSKIPPFPNLSQIRDALGDQLIWDLYKEKVVSEILS